ncbi:hypothetical protein AX769_21445 (plasmid) [Frondihabitans sp. PAMC 28766]|uniref:hypothetical protein n=1 Tax=Frondihabitans sp. PAMC 28766 TaxID=1795630 RepID=UPI00078C02D1|nr:hypothetical protein [Frondihabitans sp. PAMC 28766]AMM22692.1 hypothetical protein AX769_21445 [Frondihabitans sp. PAMC 28766]
MTATSSRPPGLADTLASWRGLTFVDRSRRVAEASLQAAATVLIGHPAGRDAFPVSAADTLMQICSERRNWAPTWSVERLGASLEFSEGLAVPVAIVPEAQCTVDWIAKNVSVALAVGDIVSLHLPGPTSPAVRLYFTALERRLARGILAVQTDTAVPLSDTDPSGITIMRGLDPPTR